MSLCRYLPTPSDRMAVIWTLLSIEDAIVLEYGPAGTTHFSLSLFGSMGLETNNNLFTTHISEDDVIMGDVSRLENAIMEIDEEFKPRVIFVLDSAVTSVIGTDLAGVCHYMGERVSAQLIPIEGGGFRGDYAKGLRNIYSQLVRLLSKADVAKQQVYNILGASASGFRIQSDVWELGEMIKDAFALKKGVVLGLSTNISELEAIGGAGINLVLRAEALPAAEYLRETFGTPFVYGSPYGYSATMNWIKRIGDELNKKANEDFLNCVNAHAREAQQFKMYKMMAKRKPAATIVGDYDLLIGLSAFCSEMGIKVTNQICSHSLNDIPDHPDEINYYSEEKERLNILQEIKGQLILADDVSLHVTEAAGSNNTGICVSAPFFRTKQIASHLPVMGIRGADALMEIFYRYLNTLN